MNALSRASRSVRPMIMKDSKRKKNSTVPSVELSRNSSFSLVELGSSLYHSSASFTPLIDQHEDRHRSGEDSSDPQRDTLRLTVRYTALGAGQ